MAGANSQSDKRESILVAAEKVFDACGYAATTVDAVATEAGISKGSIYNYFDSKEDLFTQAFNAAIALEEAAVAEFLTGPLSPAQKVECYLDYWFARVASYKKIGRLVLEFWATVARRQGRGEMNRNLRHTYARWREQLAGIVSEGVRSGAFRSDSDPVAAAAMILGVMDGLLVQTVMDVGVVIDESFLTALKRGLLSALGAKSEPDRPDAAAPRDS